MITLFHIFYNQHEMLSKHFAAWKQHPKGMFKYVIIDDCSPKRIAKNHCVEELSIIRITRDIPWNMGGARNLGFHVASSDWVLGADIDHVVTANAAEKISSLDLSDPNVAYRFKRVRETDGRVGNRTTINILMNKKRFFETGGYDEDFSGHYAKEETFFRHCLQRHSVRFVECDHIALSWHPKRGRTRGLNRDETINTEIFRRKVAALKRGIYKNGPLLRFKWEIIP
jgi:hypothetical protein